MEGYHSSAEQQGHQEHQDHHAREKWQNSNPYTVPFSIVLAGVIIAGAIMFTRNNDSVAPTKKLAQAGDAAPTATAADIKAVESNGPVLGKSDAPITIVEFADFQCPFCGRFYQSTAKDIIEKYVKTGKAKLIYHDFAFLGEESNWAAQAARCAGDQGKYWQYHDYLYEHQNGENEGSFAKNNLKSFALEVGLNADDFNTCLDSGKHAQEVLDDTEAGRKLGVTGTPTSFVNGKIVQGAVSFSQFEPTILKALQAK